MLQKKSKKLNNMPTFSHNLIFHNIFRVIRFIKASSLIFDSNHPSKNKSQEIFGLQLDDFFLYLNRFDELSTCSIFTLGTPFTYYKWIPKNSPLLLKKIYLEAIINRTKEQKKNKIWFLCELVRISKKDDNPNCDLNIQQYGIYAKNNFYYINSSGNIFYESFNPNTMIIEEFIPSEPLPSHLNYLLPCFEKVHSEIEEEFIEFKKNYQNLDELEDRLEDLNKCFSI